MEEVWSGFILFVQMALVLAFAIGLVVVAVNAGMMVWNLVSIRAEFAEKRLRNIEHDKHMNFLAEIERKNQKALPGVIDAEDEELEKWKQPKRSRRKKDAELFIGSRTPRRNTNG